MNLCGSKLKPVWFLTFVVSTQDLCNLEPVWLSCVCFDDDSENKPESRMTRVHQAHWELATFQTQCVQKLFKKAMRVLSAMKGVVESFSHAGINEETLKFETLAGLGESNAIL